MQQFSGTMVAPVAASAPMSPMPTPEPEEGEDVLDVFSRSNDTGKEFE